MTMYRLAADRAEIALYSTEFTDWHYWGNVLLDDHAAVQQNRFV